MIPFGIQNMDGTLIREWKRLPSGYTFCTTRNFVANGYSEQGSIIINKPLAKIGVEGLHDAVVQGDEERYDKLITELEVESSDQPPQGEKE